MADVRPFRAIRPSMGRAGDVIAPPYDVLSLNDVRAIVAAHPDNFVRVTRSEVDLEDGADPHSAAAYAKAKATLDMMQANGVLSRDTDSCFTFYGQRMGEHTQVGILAAASVDEYLDGRIAKHEFTRPDKEDDRTAHMEALDAQVGLVFLTYRPNAVLQAITQRITSERPDWSVTTDDGVVHECWIAPSEENAAISEAFSNVDKLYIADGHHRSAAAARVHANRRTPESAYFLAGLFPSDRLKVLAYNRVVADLNGHSVASFRERLGQSWIVEPGADTPSQRGEIAMFLQGSWWTLTPKPNLRSDDPVRALDVSLLQEHLLAPVLGIDNPRKSQRIAFVGGIHGPAALERAVQQGAAVAFHMYPTSLDELFSVADDGQVMPPKSTWFEPKLREGVVVRSL